MIKWIVIFILTPKYLKISALSIDVPTDSWILRLQKPHSVVYRQTLSHSWSIFHIILEKVVWGLPLLEWRWWSAHQKRKKIIRKSPTSLLPTQAPLLLHPTTQHVQVQQSRQTLQIKKPHVLQEWILPTRQNVPLSLMQKTTHQNQAQQ